MIDVTGTIVITMYNGCDEYSEYLIKRTLNHLPKIRLGEDDIFDVHVLHSNAVTMESSHDDFDNPSLNDFFKNRERFRVVLDGVFYRRSFDEIQKFVVKWLTRLDARLWLDAVCIRIWDGEDEKRCLSISDSGAHFGRYGVEEEQERWEWYRLITADQKHFTDAWNEYYCGVSAESSETEE